MLMRERISDFLPRRSSPSRKSDPDENESSKIRVSDVSNRSDPSRVQIDVVSHGFENRKHNVDGIQRECGYSDLYDVDIQRGNGFSNNGGREEKERDDERYVNHFNLQEDSGNHKRNRSDPTETVKHGLRSLVPSAEEPSRLGEERKPSGFITSRDNEYSPSHGRNVMLRNDETNRVKSVSREYSGSSRQSEDGRGRDTYIQTSSPLSQVGSSTADFQDESSRQVSVDSRSCIRVNDSDGVHERRRHLYSEDIYASPVPESRRLDDYVGRNSPKDQQGAIFCGVICGNHDSPNVRRCGKEIVDESRKNYHIGSDIAMREIRNVARDSDLLMQTRGSLSNVYGSNIVDVDAVDTNLEFCKAEKMADQYDFVNEQYPSVDLRSRLGKKRDGKDHMYKSFCNEEGEVVYLDNRSQLLRNDYQYDGVNSRTYPDFSGPDAVVDRDDEALHSRTPCLNKEKEAYSGNEKKVDYSDDRRRELQNEYHFGNDARMHSDVHGADIVVDQYGRVVQLQRGGLNEVKAVYLDNERTDVYQHCKSQQLKRDYDSGIDVKIYPDVNRLDSEVERENARGQRYHRGVSLNERKSQQLLKDHQTDSYDMMHPDVNKSDILVDREYARGQRYRGVSLNDKKEAYLQCESQQLLHDRETNSYVMMHPDINRSDILVDQEDARGLRYGGGSRNDRHEAYLYYENQQLLKDHETNSYGMMHPNLNKSDILVDREDARALELRRVSFDNGTESYLYNKKGDSYLHYERQLEKDYNYGIDDRTYRDVNSSDIIVDHGNAKALERRRVSRNDVYPHYEIQERKKDYYSDIDARMYHDVDRPEIAVDRNGARALERRGVSLNDERETYLHYESQKLLKNHETDSYGRSSASKQDEEALRGRRYNYDRRNHVYLDDERLQLHNSGHVKVHANTRYPDGRQDVYHSNDDILLTKDEYGLRGEVIHENMADGYNYSDVKQSRRFYEKPDSERRGARDYRDKGRNYVVEGGTRIDQFRDLVDERNYGNVDQTSAPRPRVSVKDRLGGRVEESRVHVKDRVLHQVRNPNLKGKSYKRKQSYVS